MSLKMHHKVICTIYGYNILSSAEPLKPLGQFKPLVYSESPITNKVYTQTRTKVTFYVIFIQIYLKYLLVNVLKRLQLVFCLPSVSINDIIGSKYIYL